MKTISNLTIYKWSWHKYLKHVHKFEIVNVFFDRSCRYIIAGNDMNHIQSPNFNNFQPLRRGLGNVCYDVTQSGLPILSESLANLTKYVSICSHQIIVFSKSSKRKSKQINLNSKIKISGKIQQNTKKFNFNIQKF